MIYIYFVQNVLVIGSNGFVGDHIVQTILYSETCMVVGMDLADCSITEHKNYTYYKGNILEDNVINEILKKQRIDVIIYAVGLYGKYNCETIVKTNSITILELLNQLVTKKHIKLFVLSSSSIYGQKTLDELPVNETSQLTPDNSYGYSKLFLEQLCTYYTNKHRLNITIIRPSNFIGPGIREDLVIGKIINQIKEKIENDNIEITLYNKTSKRDFIAINHFSNIIIELLQKDNLPHIINVGSGIALSIENIVNTISEQINRKIEIKTLFEEPEIDKASHYLNVNKLLKVLDTSKDTFNKIADQELKLCFNEIFK